MKKEYDFSNSEPSPYWKRILKEGIEIQHDLRVSLKDIVNTKEVIAENKVLKRKIAILESKFEDLAAKIKKQKPQKSTHSRKRS